MMRKYAMTVLSNLVGLLTAAADYWELTDIRDM